MYDWIYIHFINTYWFLMTVLSIPFLLGFYLAYKAWKDRDTDNVQDQQGQQDQQDQQNGQNSSEEYSST